MTGLKSRIQLPSVDARVWISLTYTALVMIGLDYYGKSDNAVEFFPEWFSQFSEMPEFAFYTKLYWCAFGILIYFLIPWAIIRSRGERLSDYGVRLPSSYGHLWIYVAMLLAVVVMAYFASFQESFLRTYPYYSYFREEPLYYGLFWAGRAVRFFALEFFFRGYLLFSLKRKFGDASFFVSMVPYCMLHFGKPMAETVFAVVGGIIFCWIAARTKSIWGAVVLHVCLALAMDFFAILRTGYLIAGCTLRHALARYVSLAYDRLPRVGIPVDHISGTQMRQ